MANERWLRLKALHERVFELPLEAAREIVERELADDPELAKELVSLLEQKTEDTSFLKFDDAPVSPSIFPPHHRLGDYELLHEIGRGGMGFVYMARHLPLERDVALKVLNPSLSFRQEHVDRFRREAQRLAQFKNPGIVPIFDVQSIDSVHFFAMEFVDGLDLHRELVCLRKQAGVDSHRATLPPADSKGYFKIIAGIVRQAAGALADAHEHRITHRDIKPHNLILGRDGRLRIVDFGIARDESMGRAKDRDEPAGTIYYMSPEQAKLSRDRVVDHRTDIYSLGVVLYELLTLKRPFDGATQTDILKAIEVREPKPIRSLNPRAPRDLAVICHTAMEKDAARRYSTAREFAADLERFLSGEAIRATPPTTYDRVRRWSRKNRIGISSSAVAAVAVLSGFFLREQLAADPRMARLDFVLESAPVDRAPQRLSYRTYDPIEERFGEWVDLGAPPFGEQEVLGGLIRLRVDYPGGQFSELGRHARLGGEATQILVPARGARPFSAEGMATIPAGTLRRRVDPCVTGCSNLGKDIPVASFLLDRHEVTVAEYREFLQASGRAPPEHWEKIRDDRSLDNRPVVGVDYLGMRAFAEFHGKRLPTHAEWEWAARGAEDRRTPTGAPFSPELRANIHGQAPAGAALEDAGLAAWRAFARDVGSSPDDVTPEGVFDLLGNVHECVEAGFVHHMTEDRTPQIMTDVFLRIGSAWFTDDTPVLLEYHSLGGVGEVGNFLADGFRCARSLTP